MSEMIAMLIQIEHALKSPTTWSEHQEAGMPHEARVWKGEASGWMLVLSTFEIESQGFPKGSRGCDCVASKDGKIVRLTRELSRAALATIPGGE